MQQSKFRTVLRVTSGNFLEMFDFFLFGFYATIHLQDLFPRGERIRIADVYLYDLRRRFSDAAARGSYPGRLCRPYRPPRGLITTLAIMACGTILIAFTPGYGTVGIVAPLLVLFGRLLQGFSAGVELGGVSVYLSEMATPGHKGFYVSWQSASQQVAIVAAAAMGTRSMYGWSRRNWPSGAGAFRFWRAA